MNLEKTRAMHSVVAVLFGFYAFMFDLLFLFIENQWIHNLNITKQTKFICILMMAMLTISDCQIYNIAVCMISVIFAVIYYQNGKVSSNKTEATVSSV